MSAPSDHGPDQDLRTTLHRLADAGDPLPVADDLWQRGRAARRRGQALAVAAIVLVVVSVGGTLALWSAADREARTASTVPPGGAIPSRIEDIPSDLEVTSDLAVGRASAAFLSPSTGDPVVITATDGVPHRLDLGDWGPDPAALALSPDGGRLAYQQVARDGTRVAVLDLETGRTRQLLANPDASLEIDGLSWSPNGDWLGWVSSAMGDASPWAGVLRTDGSQSARALLPGNASSIAVADTGDSVLGRVNGSLFLLPLRATLKPVRLPAPGGSAGAYSPNGSQVALGTGPGQASYTFEVPTGNVVRHPFPEDTLGESVIRPLGWLDERLQLLLVQSLDGASRDLVVTTPEVDDTSTWRMSVGSVSTTGVANSLSLAVDLVPDLDGTSSQPLTHDFDVPIEQRVPGLITLAAAAALTAAVGLLIGARLLRLRRRPV